MGFFISCMGRVSKINGEPLDHDGARHETPQIDQKDETDQTAQRESYSTESTTSPIRGGKIMDLQVTSCFRTNVPLYSLEDY